MTLNIEHVKGVLKHYEKLSNELDKLLELSTPYNGFKITLVKLKSMIFDEISLLNKMIAGFEYINENGDIK